MKIAAESTNKVVVFKLDKAEVQARIWEAQTETGVKCFLYVTRVMVDEHADHEQFQKELLEHKAPSAEAQEIPLRMIL